MKQTDQQDIAATIIDLNAMSQKLYTLKQSEVKIYNDLTGDDRDAENGRQMRDNIITLQAAREEITDLVTLLNDLKATAEK